MVTRCRHITAAAMLASYMLATAAAWLHVAHVRHVAPHAASGSSDRFAACAHQACCLPASAGPISAGQVEQRVGGQVDRPLPASGHDHENCALCRFQLTKKLVEYLPAAVSLPGDSPEQVVLEVPLVRVASLPATFQSRAPPVLA